MVSAGGQVVEMALPKDRLAATALEPAPAASRATPHCRTHDPGPLASVCRPYVAKEAGGDLHGEKCMP